MSSSFRSILFKDISVKKLWSAWTRGYIFSSVVRRCRRERAVIEVLQCFRQTFFKPRRTLLISATAAYHSRGEATDCNNGITDAELESLLKELDVTKDLVKSTLQCTRCGKRIVIDKRQNRVQYCDCKDGRPASQSSDGWVPFMEAEDVIIWRKEYKPGQGLYAYKVYGRYSEVNARDFAAVQLDGAYRRVWDAAVAALAVVQRSALGVHGQAVLHWEVLWPRLFANRDYVYIRRHKEFDALGEHVIEEKVRSDAPAAPQVDPDQPTNVHAKAKRKSMENYAMEEDGKSDLVVDNKVYIIVSRSCEHPDVPETKHAIRVLEYWSHMVVKTTQGVDKPGMEFVLTYYDEPAAGGLPGGVAAWASGRAAPGYLARMRTAAARYRNWAADTPPHDQEMPDFTPFDPQLVNEQENSSKQISEQDMESSKDGPELEHIVRTRDQGTQTEDEIEANRVEVREDNGKVEVIKTNENQTTVKTQKDTIARCVVEVKNEEVAEECKKEEISDSKKETPKEVSLEGEPEEKNGTWWRYMYPFYYFV
ncbi:uncharacterized protein [Battus philenor]|uniref:uncharacterized protein n=1 Tax=Battus philenor TaxID=42288 RepID=UPI0035CF6538